VPKPKVNSKKKLGELLIDTGVISDKICNSVLREQKSGGKRLGELLVEKGFTTESDIAQALASQLGLPLVDLKMTPVEPDAVNIISEAVAKKHLIMPVAVEGRDLFVAMHDPFSFEALEDARFASGYDIRPYIATKEDIIWSINKNYNLKSSLEEVVVGMSSDHKIDMVEEVTDDHADIATLGDLKKQSEKAPIIKMVNLIFVEAVNQRASDIHIDPAKKEVVIRYRIDGLLRVTFALPKWVQAAVTSRIKIMAGLDISEKRLPQDGKISIKVKGGLYDLRVSTLPTKLGEKVVIRVLDTMNSIVASKELGMEENIEERFAQLITRPQGIILVTGPTGSGKTTTLYSTLGAIKTPEINIITVEDPVEYEVEGISQVSVNEKIGFTFSTALRSILRQDPDVVMVGEMRDIETAKIAIQAALTGHLVLSTVHTNSAVATITRLRDFGIPSYLIASTIIGIIAQRLVRVTCPLCKEHDYADKTKLAKLGLSEAQTRDVVLYKGKGCSNCANVGYSGRAGLYEVLPITESLQELISSEAKEPDILRVALQEGLKTLAQVGREKVIKGETSLEELCRVVTIDQAFSSPQSQQPSRPKPSTQSKPSRQVNPPQQAGKLKESIEKGALVE